MTTRAAISQSSLIPNMKYAMLATNQQIERTVKALEANNIHAVVVATGAEAKEAVLAMLPAGAEVLTGASKTLEAIGLVPELETTRFDNIRNRFKQMDRKTQGREFRKLGAAPDFMLGSVQAVTEQGEVLVASASGSQIGPYASGAGSVIWVVGAQKLVPNLEEGLRRVREYAYPLEDARARSAYGMPTKMNKVLIINGDWPGRLTMVIVKENIGF